MKKQTLLLIFSVIVILGLFLLVSYLVQKNIEFFEGFFDYPVLGMLIYLFLLIFETVFAPVTILPLIPIASNIWGPFITALLLIIGWSVGAIIAFLIARHYGLPLVEKIVSLERIRKMESLIPERNIFLGIVILRIMIPVDVLSYVLGIFSGIKLRTYIIATLIGIAPGAFLISYIGKLPFLYQINAILIGGIIIMLIVIAAIFRKNDPKDFFRKLWDSLFK